MKKERRKFTSAFKAKVAIEAIKEDKTIQELASKHQVYPSQITTWKKEFLDNASMVFESKRHEEKDESKDKILYSKIGELQIEIDFLKKVLGK
jgi:transposase-like protein